METKEKIGFFKRIQIAVSKLEEYAKLIEQKWTKALGYLFVLVLLISAVISVIQVMDLNKMFEKAYSFVNTLPNFTYSKGKIEENIYAYGYDEELSLFFLMDTSRDYQTVDEITNLRVGLKEQYGADYMDAEIKMYAYKSNLYLDTYDLVYQMNYKEELDAMGIAVATKADTIKNINEIGKPAILIVSYGYLLLTQTISLFVTFILDAIIMMLFIKIIGAWICGIKFTYSQAFTIAIHAETLPILILLIYNVINYFTGFYMEYISYMLMIIEYVYSVAVIFIIKNEKQLIDQELKEVEKVHEEVKKELAEKIEEAKEVVVEEQNEESKEPEDKSPEDESLNEKENKEQEENK